MWLGSLAEFRFRNSPCLLRLDARMLVDAYDTIWDAFLGIGTLIVRLV